MLAVRVTPEAAARLRRAACCRIGLAAISYVIDGHITHRDSLSSPRGRRGRLNFMIAGRGMVHSERFDPDANPRRAGSLPLLLALPDGTEDMEPSFLHVRRDEILCSGSRVDVRDLWSSARFHSGADLQEVRIEAGARYSPPEAFKERGLYVLKRSDRRGGTRIDAQQPGTLTGQCVRYRRGICSLLAFVGEPVGQVRGELHPLVSSSGSKQLAPSACGLRLCHPGTRKRSRPPARTTGGR